MIEKIKGKITSYNTHEDIVRAIMVTIQKLNEIIDKVNQLEKNTAYEHACNCQPGRDFGV